MFVIFVEGCLERVREAAIRYKCFKSKYNISTIKKKKIILFFCLFFLLSFCDSRSKAIADCFVFLTSAVFSSFCLIHQDQFHVHCWGFIFRVIS